MSPVVFPSLSSKVKDPRIVEVEEPSSLTKETSIPLPMSSTEVFELAGGREEEMLLRSVVLIVEIESLGLETELSLELRDKFSAKIGKPEASGGTIVTTLTPWPVVPLAGIKSVVEPSFRFKCVRSG